MHSIVLYGATGYTGRLVAAELARKGADFAIAGRDARKLEALARSLPGAREREMIVAPLDEPAALVRMARRARVILDCAGPFARMGRPVLDAALEAGAHFLDITGEGMWMMECLARDREARAAGIAVINGVGFDVVPSDCVAVLAAEAAGAPVESIEILIAPRSFRATQGTTRSAVEAAGFGGAAFVNGALHPEPVGEVRREVEVGGRTRLFVSVPWGDIVTAPRSTGARTVRVLMPAPRRLVRFLGLLPLVQPLLRTRAFAALGERYVRGLPEGPTPEQRAGGSFTMIGVARGARGEARVEMTGPDGYDLTAVTATLCAMRAADPSFAGRGSLTPTQAFGAKSLLDALAPAVVTRRI